MPELGFTCAGVRVERYALAPTLVFRIRAEEHTGARVHVVALRCQIMIEAQRRRYSEAEGARLSDLFGGRERWGDTLKPMLLTNVAQMVPGFTGSVEFDLPVPCTYDQEVASARYLASLGDGEVPLLLLFSGTVFYLGGSGMLVEQVPWDREASVRMPVATWRELIRTHFPDSGWLRLREDTLAALERFKSSRVLAGWDETLLALLKQAGEDVG